MQSVDSWPLPTGSGLAFPIRQRLCRSGPLRFGGISLLEFTDDACYIGISGSDCAGCLMPTARSTTASRIPAAADCRAETARIMTTFDPA